MTTRPPFDPEVEPMLRALDRGTSLDVETLSAVRQRSAAPTEDPTAGGRVRVRELTAPGRDGGPEVSLVVLSPTTQSTPLPLIYYVHGGGMIAGTHRAVDRVLDPVAEGRAVVVSVGYRLAPEHPDPAPVDDCYAGLVWSLDHAEALGIDPGRVIVLGVSAGGGIAAGTALLLRDRGGPTVSHLMLLCPMLDDRLETLSSQMLDGEGTWDRHENLFGWTALLGERRGGSDVSPYAAPARATDLSRLPRTYLDVGSADSFRDEVLAFGEQLSAAGVSVDLHLWGGGIHGFDVIAPDAAISRACNAVRAEFLDRALAGR